MTVALLLAISFGVGVGVRRRWVVLLPFSLGCVSATLVSMSGHSLNDTPIPFLVLSATGAVVVGVLMRMRWLRHSL